MRPQGHSGWVFRNWYDHALALIKTFSDSRNRRTLDKRVIVQFSDNLPLDLLLFFFWFVCLFFSNQRDAKQPTRTISDHRPSCAVHVSIRLVWIRLNYNWTSLQRPSQWWQKKVAMVERLKQKWMYGLSAKKNGCCRQVAVLERCGR